MTIEHESFPNVAWPDWWKGKGHHLLEGMPIFGTQNKIIHHVCRVLQARTEAMFISEWTKTQFSIELCTNVSQRIWDIVNHYIKWPNAYFFPGDKNALLLGIIPGVWFDTEDVLEEVGGYFRLSRVNEKYLQFLDLACEGEYLELVKLISAEGESLKSKRPAEPL